MLRLSQQYLPNIIIKSRPHFTHLNLRKTWKSRPPPHHLKTVYILNCILFIYYISYCFPWTFSTFVILCFETSSWVWMALFSLSNYFLFEYLTFITKGLKNMTFDWAVIMIEAVIVDLLSRLSIVIQSKLLLQARLDKHAAWSVIQIR